MTRLRVLHLAFEDPRRPGSGGGAVRTREINTRLARRHDVEVVTTGWPGARPRTEDGVRWSHTPSLPGRGSSLPYFAVAPLLARRRGVDLVVEDFAAPISTLGLPRFTSTPVVAVVQWLFAAEKAAQYHLPFDRVETWGLRQHTTFVAVSEGLGARLRERAPHAAVHVVENGVDLGAPVAPDGAPDSPADVVPDGRYLLFLGRLENAQKGVDVALRALADPALAGSDVPLVLAGDGPDEAVLRALADRLGVGRRLRWAGRVEGAAKRALMAGAAAVLVPSRYETFGMVAAEAMAAGAPVVASDVDCLRDVVARAGGVLVPPERPDALAAAVAALLADPARAADLGARGRAASARWDWDALAEQQERVYLDVVSAHQARGR